MISIFKQFILISILIKFNEVKGDIISESVARAVAIVDGKRRGQDFDSYENEDFTDTSDTQDIVVNTPLSIMRLFSKRQEAPDAVAAVARSSAIAETATVILAKRLREPISAIEKSSTSSKFERAMKPYCAVKKINCDPRDRYRSPDGTCNNLEYPLRGSAFTAQPRYIPPKYGDSLNSGTSPRLNSVRGGELPNPRDISNAIHDGGRSPPRNCLVNEVFTHFGQFVDHDVISTPVKEAKEGRPPIRCCRGNRPVNRPECFAFCTPPGEFQTDCMHFVRSESAPTNACSPGVRNQMNQRTSYLDLSSTYGSTQKTMDDLRDLKTGKMKEGPGRLLPSGKGNCITGSDCFKSGDSRHTEVPQLNTIHTLFSREHNRIVDILSRINTHWNGERLFQETRKLLIGIYQHIVYNEFLPPLIGERYVNYFGLRPTRYGFNHEYNVRADAGTRNAFGAAAFRIGHSLVGSFVGSSDIYFRPRKRLPMESEFFNPRTIRDTRDFGVEGITRWMLNEFASSSDRFFTPSIRNHLFETRPRNGFDLSALNIQRGRDHGLPSYNDFRRYCGLRPAITFSHGLMGCADHDRHTSRILGRMYKHPEDIDLYVGALSEIPMRDALVGPTFGCLLGLQFYYYKVGDRFFYENDYQRTGFTRRQLDIIKRQTLASLYCRNFELKAVQTRALFSPLPGNDKTWPGHFSCFLEFLLPRSVAIEFKLIEEAIYDSSDALGPKYRKYIISVYNLKDPKKRTSLEYCSSLQQLGQSDLYAWREYTYGR